MDTSTIDKQVKTKQAYSILLIENDPELRKVMKISLEQCGMRVTAVSKSFNVLKVLEDDIPDFFLVDFDFPGADPGKLIQVFRELKKDSRGFAMVTTTSRPDDNWRRRYQPDAVIYKPFDLRHLQRRISALTKTIAG